MSAAHVRRGGTGRAKPRKPRPRSRCRRRSPSGCRSTKRRANKLAGLVFAAFLLAIGIVVLVALDIPAKAERTAGDGDRPGRLHRQRLSDRRHQPHEPRADRRRRDRRAAACRRRGGARQGAAGAGRRRRDPPAACCAIGWVKDARVSRRLPDTLVIDIVERTPAALWQKQRPPGADRRGRRGRSTASRSIKCRTCRC